MQTSKRLIRSAKISTRGFAAASSVEAVSGTKVEIAHHPSQLTVSRGALANGITCGSVNSVSPIVNVKFSVNAGSQFETESEQGAAHLLSVAAFAGTQNRSGLELCRYLESLGAEFHSTVDREKITYNVSFLSCYAERVFSAMASALVSAPRSFVLDEMKHTAQLFYDKVSNTPSLKLNELIHEAAFTENSGLGASMYAPNLHDLCSNDVLAFREKHFKKSNVTVSGTGIDLQELKQLTSVFLAHLPDGHSVAPESPFIGGSSRCRSDLHGKSAVSVGFPMELNNGKGSAVYQVLHQALQASLNAANVNAVPFFHEYAQNGVFGFHVMGNAEQVNRDVSSIAGQMKALASGSGLNEQETFRRAVALSQFEDLTTMRGTETVHNFVRRNKVTVEGLDARNVSLSDVKSAAAACVKANPAFAVLGKTRSVMSQKDVAALLR